MAYFKTPHSKKYNMQVKLSDYTLDLMRENAKKSGFSTNADYVRWLLEKNIVRK